MQSLLTTKEVAEYFRVTEDTVTQKFIPKGLKYFPASSKDYRYNEKDILEFEEQLKKQTQQKVEVFNQTKRLNDLKLVKKNVCRVS